MEKTIKLNEKDLRLEANTISLIIYESQFGEDPLPAMGKVVDAIRGEIKLWDVGALNVARLTWSMAKTRDPEFPDFRVWFEGLGAFPTIEVFNQISELVSVNLITHTDIKPKNAKRAEN